MVPCRQLHTLDERPPDQAHELDRIAMPPVLQTPVATSSRLSPSTGTDSGQRSTTRAVSESPATITRGMLRRISGRVLSSDTSTIDRHHTVV